MDGSPSASVVTDTVSLSVTYERTIRVAVRTGSTEEARYKAEKAEKAEKRKRAADTKELSVTLRRLRSERIVRIDGGCNRSNTSMEYFSRMYKVFEF